MKRVIDIDENVFTRLFDNGVETSEEDRKVIDAAVRKSIALPEGADAGEFDAYIHNTPSEESSSKEHDCRYWKDGKCVVDQLSCPDDYRCCYFD